MVDEEINGLTIHHPLMHLLTKVPYHWYTRKIVYNLTGQRELLSRFLRLFYESEVFASTNTRQPKPNLRRLPITSRDMLM